MMGSSKAVPPSIFPGASFQHGALGTMGLPSHQCMNASQCIEKHISLSSQVRCGHFGDEIRAPFKGIPPS